MVNRRATLKMVVAAVGLACLVCIAGLALAQPVGAAAPLYAQEESGVSTTGVQEPRQDGPVVFPPGDWPWYAQGEISVHPEPPIAGHLTELCATVINVDPVDPHPATLVFGIADFVYLRHVGELPSLKTLWWLAVLLPPTCGALVTLGGGGATLGQRFVGAAVCGVATGLFYTVISALLGQSSGVSLGTLGTSCLWRVFLLSMFTTMGAIVTELILPDPDLK